MEEIWKDIKGYPNYMVSNMGRVKSLGNDKTRKEKILKGSKNSDGYLAVNLSKDGKQKNYKIHRLVASAFLDNSDNLLEINHKDEDKTNNMVWVNDDGSIDYNKSNLEWCNREYNVNYGSRTEKTQKPILQFTKNGEFVRRWESISEVKRELGFDISSIIKCCKGKKRYKSVGGFKWGYEKDYERIKFNVFDLEIYEKKVA